MRFSSKLGYLASDLCSHLTYEIGRYIGASVLSKLNSEVDICHALDFKNDGVLHNQNSLRVI